MLSINEKQELLHGFIGGGLINKFFYILSELGFDTQYCDLYSVCLEELIHKVDKRQLYIQVLPDEEQLPKPHWVLFKYAKKGMVYVYDSLNKNFVTDFQKKFLQRVLCQKIIYEYKHVQEQNHPNDCGAMVMAFTISLILERDVENELYLRNEIRTHLLSIIENKVVVPCKSVSLSALQNECIVPREDTHCNNVESHKPQQAKDLQLSTFYDEGVSENIYNDINYQFDEDQYKYVSTIEEIVYEYEVVEVYFSTSEQIRMEHSYSRSRPEKFVQNYNNRKRKIVDIDNSTLDNPTFNNSTLSPKRRLINILDGAINEYSCGRLDVKCPDCSALHFVREISSDKKYTQCCHKGRVILQRPKCLTLINQLLTDTSHPWHKNFITNIRRYNSALSFASCGAQIVTPPGYGPYCYKIHGQIYHRTSHGENSLQTGEPRKYAQLYFIDTEEALNERFVQNCNSVCDRELLKNLDIVIREVNPYAQAYKMLREITQNMPNANVSLSIREDRNLDCRRYNKPNSNEIAVVFKSDDGRPPFERDIRVYPKAPKNNDTFINISTISCNLDPMCYALMFPFGEPGWSPDMIDRNGKNVTLLQYKSAMMSITDPPNPILNYGKLLQQWIVDSFVQVESKNLDYIRHNQDDLRVESYQGLMDYISHKDKESKLIGRPIILPSSFEGSPRNMRQKYLDAMAICGRYGTPDLFITFTSNPNWVEIKENLLRDQTPSDRPELVSRVFNLKLRELINDIVDKEIFGPVVAFVYTIEFQKRGLPHAHMLFILKHKLLTSDDVDRIICAEIPDPIEDKILHRIVVNQMIHGPCGNFCLDEKGKCSKKFPKSFQESTEMDRGGYPLYRRREGKTAIKNKRVIDNRDVVPYNKYLLKKFNAHINVEACITVKSIKYIFKYIYKGFDCAAIEFKYNDETVTKYDEISSYLNCRYISACEAAWRLFEFKMQGRSHFVCRLAVHLPSEQSVTFKPGQEALATNASASTLTAWFELNKTDANSNQYKYPEIPYHYVFDKKNKKWTIRRAKFNVIPRLYTVSPKNVELFNLRLLLLHCSGAISFEDIRTVDGKLYDKFEDAAIAKGLVQNNEVYIQTMNEMATFEMPEEMRRIFAYMCVFCSIANPNILWNLFKDSLSEDFQRRYSKEIAFQKTLEKIDEILKMHNTSCEKFNLAIDRELLSRYSEIESCNEQILSKEEVDNRISTLNNKQLEIFEKVIAAYEGKSDKTCFFIDGPGGCGKTYLYNMIIDCVESKHGIVLAYASTGIAALLLKNGRTVHSGFKLPIPLLEDSTSFIFPWSREAELFRKSRVIIIDECSMMDKFMLECVERLLYFLMQNDKIFGNKIIILGGDFRQTLPVIPRGSRAAIIERCLKSSNLWNNFCKFSLTENMRCLGNSSFNEFLLNVGNGKINNSDDTISIDKKFISYDIIADIYGNDLSIDAIRSKIILCVRNSRALELNNEIISSLPGENTVYYSADSVESDDSDEIERYTPDFLYTLTPSGIPPHELKLKVGAVVMLLRNLNISEGLCNGTRLIVKKFHKNVICCEILSGKNVSKTVYIPQIELIPSDTTLPFKLKRRQFPLIPAFVITINKSQGQTFEHVGIDLGEEVFAHGQLYTALSRVTKEENLKISLNHNTNETKNIVYNDVLN